MQLADSVRHAAFTRLVLHHRLRLGHIRVAGSKLVQYLVRSMLALAKRRQQVGSRRHTILVGKAA